MRLCDREGCTESGDRPAPKAPNSPERWYFCESPRRRVQPNWNYFAGLSPEEAARRAAEEEQGASAFASRRSGNGRAPATAAAAATRCARLDALELDSDADFKAVKAAHRRLVKETHPDANPGNAEAAKRFKQIQAAYDVLRKAEERKERARRA